MNWTGEYRAFIVETYYKNNESVTVVQRASRLRFGLKRHDFIPIRNTILLCVANFGATGSTLKKKSIGCPWTARTPANVDAVNDSFQQSPKRSLRKHALSQAISKSSMHRILRKDLKLHRSLEELKRAIRLEIDAIPPKLIHRVTENCRERLLSCVSNDGKHLNEFDI